MSKVFTIGHSNHTFDNFLQLLQKYDVNCVCDVRSTPLSRFASQFNRERLKSSLQTQGISYIFFGNEFGARRKEEDLYTDGIVDFDKVAKTDVFLNGIKRIQDGIEKGYRIAFMCAEKDPLDCHRTLLVARKLTTMGISIEHILSDASVKTQQQIEKELFIKYCPNQSILGSLDTSAPIDLLDMAYRKANDKIGYRKLLK